MTQVLKDINSSYFYKTYFGHNLIINKNGPKLDANISKLVNKIVGQHRFKELAITKRFLNAVNLYFNKKEINIHINKVLSVSHLCNSTNGIFYQIRGNPKINGTYGPIDFVEYLLPLCDHSSHIQIRNEYKQKIINILKKYNITNPNLIDDITKL
jgi:hypothetical protein